MKPSNKLAQLIDKGVEPIYAVGIAIDEFIDAKIEEDNNETESLFKNINEFDQLKQKYKRLGIEYVNITQMYWDEAKKTIQLQKEIKELKEKINARI